MIGAFLIAVLGASTAEDSTFDAFFKDFAEKRNTVCTLEAAFTQESLTDDETIEAEGTIVYAKPKRLVFRYEEPDPTYLIDGLRVYEYARDIEQMQVYELEDNPQTEVFFLGFDDDTERLREAYEVEVFEPENEPEGAKGIRLRPKDAGGEETYFESVTLLLRAADYLPYRIHIINDAESQVTIQITRFVVNGPMTPAQTQLELPEGTTIIEGDAISEIVGADGKRAPSPVVLPEHPSPPSSNRQEPVQP